MWFLYLHDVQVRLIVAVLKCVGTGELTVVDGIFLSLSLSLVKSYTVMVSKILNKGFFYDLLQSNGS